IDNDLQACETLKENRPNWRVRHADIEEISGSEFRGVDLVAAGVPCPPFSIAGKQLGAGDERDLFPEALRIIQEAEPSAVMPENGWPGALKWVSRANSIAPTIVGGSKKHGGPDLGPTRAREQWRRLGVDGLGIADAAPDTRFPINGLPRLTARMVARLQSFPD